MADNRYNLRFHHRSVQEYLAARRLNGLREKGMSIKALSRLLFAERYGVPVVIPSMRAIAAWLALWNEHVRRELMAREPETLLSMGDPESLALSVRGDLLRAFVRAYTVTREAEVADAKRTDIRLAAVRGDQKATIEIKIADKGWSVNELERALREQLVGQYLCHESCKAGCLLLTYNGDKKYWEHPGTGASMTFNELIAHLDALARTIEAEQGHAVRLSVRGLDLRNPS